MALLDKDIIFVLKLTFPDGTLKYWSTEDITISATPYDGSVIGKNSLSVVTKTIDVVSGGKYGGSAKLSFSIPRDNSDSFTGDFHNSFYPATSKDSLSATIVDLGWTYIGASSIEWMHQFSGVDVKTDYDNITVDCYETSDIDKVQVPAYEYQNDVEDRLDYIKDNLADDLMGNTIPIVYGDFTPFSYDADNVQKGNVFGMYPFSIVDMNDVRCFLACHELSSIARDPNDSNNQKAHFYRYEPANGVYQRITCIDSGSTSASESTGNGTTSGTVTYSDTRISGELMPGNCVSQMLMFTRTETVGLRLAGELIIPLTVKSDGNIGDVENLINKDITDYEIQDTTSNNVTVLTMKGSPNSDDVGFIFATDALAVLNPLTQYAHGWVEVENDDTQGSVQCRLVYYDESGTTQTSDHYREVTDIQDKLKFWHYIGMWWNSGFSDTGGSKNETKAFNEVSELSKYAWRIYNASPTTKGTKVYRAWYHFHYMDVKVATRYTKLPIKIKPPERDDRDLQSAGQVF